MNRYQFRYIGVSILLLFTNYYFAAASDNKLLFSISSENKARLGVVNNGQHGLNLEITNTDGEVFFTKAISGGHNYFQLLDLASMPDGKYQVNLSGTNTLTRKEFYIRNHKAEFEKKVKIQEPTFLLINGETLAVNYSNSEGKSINIFFELNNEVVYEDRNIPGNMVNKKYSLKKLPRGEYYVKLYSGGNIFSYPLVIK